MPVAGDRTPPSDTDLLCEKCGYVLTGLPAGSLCPECGTPTAESDPNRRQLPMWEIGSKPLPTRFLATTAGVLFRPTRFFRTLVTRPAADRSAAFAWVHWVLTSVLLALAAYGHSTGFLPAVTDSLSVSGWLIWVMLAIGTFIVLLSLTHLASRLTTWEATYRGLRLPLLAVKRGMHFHAAHYLPVALMAAVTVLSYDILIARRLLNEQSALPYLYVICGEVVVGALYLFWTYWIGMRNMMYANA